MKKILSAIITIIISIAMLSLVGCGGENIVIKETDTYIVITASNQQMQINSDTTLVDYMNSLKEDNKLDFEIKGGMVNSVNGIENPIDYSSCWMLYTNDTENSNSLWGHVEYKGNTYGSAVLGAESLIIKEGYIYIWVYQTF